MEHQVTAGGIKWSTFVMPLAILLAVVFSIALWWVAWNDSVDTTIISPRLAQVERLPAAHIRTAGEPIYRTGVTRTSGASDVVGVAGRIDEASYFADLFFSTGVASDMRNGPPLRFTLFLPTDGSVGQLPSGTIRNLTPEEKRRLVEHHIIEGTVIDVDAQTAGSMTTRSGDVLNMSFGPDRIARVGNAIVIGSFEASNGIVYLIDHVLLPPQESNI